MKSQVEESEFRTMAVKFLSDISAPTDFAYVNLFLNRVMWAGKSPFAVKKIFLNSVSAFNYPTKVFLSCRFTYIFQAFAAIPCQGWKGRGQKDGVIGRKYSRMVYCTTSENR